MARPWFPFYPGDYLRDTMDLTTTQHGAYLLLMMALWNAGGYLPFDVQSLCRVMGIPHQQWTRIGQPIITKFCITNAFGVSQKRLLLELGRANSQSDKNRIAGTISAEKRQRAFNERSTSVPTERQPSQPQPQPQEGVPSISAGQASGQSSFLPPDPPMPAPLPKPRVKPAREPDPIWDEIAKIFYASNVPTGQRSSVGAVVRDLKEMKATPSQIRSHVGYMRQQWGPKITVTMQAVVKHWAEFTESAYERRRTQEINEYCGVT